MSVMVVIPARNERETIGGLVSAARMFAPVLVMDDGSSDGTGEIAREQGTKVIRHEVGRGIGPTVMEGLRLAVSMGAERVVVMDAGGSHDPRQIGSLLARQADLVIGSRFCAGGRYRGGQRWRRIASRWYARSCSLAQRGKLLSDWTSGYRVYSAAAIAALGKHPFEARMHGWQAEALARIREAGLSVVEAPITYVAGRSSARMSTVIELIGVWLQIADHMAVYR